MLDDATTKTKKNCFNAADDGCMQQASDGGSQAASERRSHLLPLAQFKKVVVAIKVFYLHSECSITAALGRSCQLLFLFQEKECSGNSKSFGDSGRTVRID